MSLEDVKARLYSFNVSIAMLVVDAVKFGLQPQTSGFFPDRKQHPLPMSLAQDNASRVRHAEQQTSVDHFGT